MLLHFKLCTDHNACDFVLTSLGEMPQHQHWLGVMPKKADMSDYVCPGLSKAAFESINHTLDLTVDNICKCYVT